MIQSELAVLHTLKHHSKAINALAASPCGIFLLSGGDDGVVCIWDIASGDLIQSIERFYHGPAASLSWMKSGEDSISSFAIGYADGTVHIYQRKDGQKSFSSTTVTAAHEAPVEDICFDSNHGRLATVGNGHVQVWKVDKGGVLESVGKTPPRPNSLARNVHFWDEGSSVVWYYLEAHEIVCYSVQPWERKFLKKIPTRIGCAILSRVSRSVFIFNLVDGVDEYAFPSMEHLRAYPFTISTNMIMSVCCASRQGWVLVGGDGGHVRVFKHESGDLVRRIEHSQAPFPVQNVTCYSDDKTCRVFTASSGAGACDIKIWQLSEGIIKSTETKVTANNGTGLSFAQVAGMIIAGYIIITIMHFCLQQAVTGTNFDIYVQMFKDFSVPNNNISANITSRSVDTASSTATANPLSSATILVNSTSNYWLFRTGL